MSRLACFSAALRRLSWCGPDRRRQAATAMRFRSFIGLRFAMALFYICDVSNVNSLRQYVDVRVAAR